MRSIFRQSAVLLSTVLLLNAAASAEVIMLAADGGISKAHSSGITNLDIGYTLSLSGMIGLGPYLRVGLRYGFSDWGPRLDALTQEEFSDTSHIFDLSGSTWSMEIIPFARLTTHFSQDVVNVFLQGGAGAYIIHNNVEASAKDTAGNIITRTFGNGTSGAFGFQVGPGVTVGQAKPIQLEMYPLFNFMIRDENPHVYVSWNAGIVLGF